MSPSLAPERRCACGSTGPFYRNKAKPDGLSSYCQVCMKRMHAEWKKNNPEKMKAATKNCRKRNRKRVSKNQQAWVATNKDKVTAQRCVLRLRKYGLTVSEWTTLFEKQKGLCAICKRPMLPTGRKKESAVPDHDHATGRVRGILHSGCNMAIGAFSDDPNILRAAATYLEEA